MGKKEEGNNPVEFSEGESKFLKEQRLGRIATVSPDIQPHVVPVAFEFDGSHFYFGGWNLEKSQHYVQDKGCSNRLIHCPLRTKN